MMYKERPVMCVSWAFLFFYFIGGIFGVWKDLRKNIIETEYLK